MGWEEVHGQHVAGWRVHGLGLGAKGGTVWALGHGEGRRHGGPWAVGRMVRGRCMECMGMVTEVWTILLHPSFISR